MSAFNDGFTGYFIILLIAIVAHESWRWFGLAIGRGINADSALFRWVRAVSTALVAGLCLRLVIFPPGALVETSLMVRLASLTIGLGAFFVIRPTLLVGIGAGSVALLVLEYLVRNFAS